MASASQVKDSMSGILKKYSYESQRYSFIANFFKKVRGKILDVGCCRGGLKKYINQDLDYYGIDILENNFQNYIHFDLNQKGLPFKSKTFDAVSCTDVLEHLFDPLVMLREIKRVLKDDGIALVSLPNDKGLNQIFLDFFAEIKTYDDLIHDHHWRFSINTAREFSQKEFNIIAESPEYGPFLGNLSFF